MKFGELRRSGRPLSIAAVLLAVAIAIAGCSARKQDQAQSAAGDAADSAAPTGPEAKIQISYSQPKDFLHTLSLSKYSAATVLATEPAGASGTASVVRFQGGTPVWQIAVEPGMFSEMPLGFSETNYAVHEVKYGVVPPHFVQVLPDLGPPEPLEPGHFYIFSVTRKSGSVSYDAVKANADGSLQAFEADPRAGNSFRLCCNLPANFGEVPPPAPSDSGSAGYASPPPNGP